jgi:hypothetical protein
MADIHKMITGNKVEFVSGGGARTDDWMRTRYEETLVTFDLSVDRALIETFEKNAKDAKDAGFSISESN